jgi:uncharacterized integral membrane protein
MTKYLAPLGVFLGGNVLLLILMLYFPAIKTASTQLAADTAAVASVFWGWTWVVSSVRLLVFVIAELTILFVTAKAFLKVR